MEETRVRPLMVRPGARYACAGDGACCTDLHVVGPLSRGERLGMGALEATSVRRHRGLQIHALEVGVGGGCVFLQEGCRIHRDHGPGAKPSVCRRFPYGLVATPRGGRITTEHRCPCRTMGDRPLLDVDDAIASLADVRGKLVASRRVQGVDMDAVRRVSFAEYESEEERLLVRLSGGETGEDVLARGPLPDLEGVTWKDVAHLLRSHVDGTACGEALAWAGDALLSLVGEPLRWARRRPWSGSFDRAQARSPREASGEDVLSDWLADSIWDLEWSERGTFDAARSDFATRLAIGRTVMRSLAGAGVREDRAAAEGVLVAEMAGAWPTWPSIVAAFRT